MKILKFIGNLVEVIVTFINKVVWYFCYYVYLGIYTVFRIDSKNLKVKLQKRLLKPELIMIVTLYVVTFVTVLKMLLPMDMLIEKDSIDITKVDTVDVNENISDEGLEDNKQNNYSNSADYYKRYLTYDINNVDFPQLSSVNPDTVAFLKVDGTNINYPIVKSVDNDYYLTHSFDKSYNTKGWTYADYRNDFNNLDNNRNVIIYGHHLLNNTMFGTLGNISNSSNLDLKIYLKTNNHMYVYQVFSSYQIEVEVTYLQTDFLNDNKYLEFLNLLKERSSKDYNISLNANDKIITLSTCSIDNTERIVVHGKLLSIN